MKRGDRSGGLDGVLVVEKPSGPTSHDVVGLVRRLSQTRRVGHGGTLDPFAAGVLPVFLGRATRLVEYHLGATKRYRATICFGDIVDDGRHRRRADAGRRAAPDARGRRGRHRRADRPDPPGPAAVQRGPDRGPSRVPAGPCRRGRGAGAARRRDPRVHAHSSGTTATRTAPSRSLDVACSAGHVHPGPGPRPRRVARQRRVPRRAVRTASGGFRLEDAVGFEALRERPPAARTGSRALLRPIDAGLEDLPHATITADELRRLFEGLPTGPKTPLDGPPTRRRAGGRPGGTSSAVCRAVGGILHPHKVLAERRGDGRRPPTMDVARGLDGPAPVARPAVRRRRRVRRPAPRARLPPRAPRRARPAARGARPMVITFDHHPDEVLTGSRPAAPVRPRRAAGAAGRGRRRGDGRRPLRQRLRETTYDAFVGQIAARAPICRVPHDARRRVRLPAGGDARGAGGARPDARVRRGRGHPAVRARRPPRPERRRPGRDRRGRPRGRRPACSAGRTPWWARPRPPTRARPSASSCRSRCRPTATTRRAVDGTERAMRVEDGGVRVPGIATFGKTRVEFRAAG